MSKIDYSVKPDTITVLSQYRAQCSSIEKNLKDLGFEHPNVNTVIASQGMFVERHSNCNSLGLVTCIVFN